MKGEWRDAAGTPWRGRRALVTGGTGLIGSWLVKGLLAAGADVVVLVKDADPQSELLRSGDIGRVSVVNGGLEDFLALERAVCLHEVDTVFHLGAQTLVGVAYRSPLLTFEANIRGTYNLLEACRLQGDLVRRVVVASSDKAYGDKAVLPYTEDMPVDAKHPYDVSKSCTDLIAQSYAYTYGLPVAITRFGNVYGGGDLNWSRLVPDTIRSLLRRRRPVIRSDGTFLRDYIYVKDVVRAYLMLADRVADEGVRGEAFNFSGESPLSVLEMVALIQGLLGGDDLQPDVRNTARAEIRDQHLSAAKAKAVLGWEPAYDHEDGLLETIAWYRDFLGHAPAASPSPVTGRTRA